MQKCLGKYLAENVKSNINIPPKNNSAVDGYAINYEKYISNKSLIYKISAEINAGEHYAGTLKKMNVLEFLLELICQTF